MRVTIGGRTTLEGHLAMPVDAEGPFPGVVVLHEAFGLTHDIVAITDRLAAATSRCGEPPIVSPRRSRRSTSHTTSRNIHGPGTGS